MKQKLPTQNLSFSMRQLISCIQTIHRTFIVACVSVFILMLTFPIKGWSQLTITVNSASDASDADDGVNNVCADVTGNCTLRAAIEMHNQHAFQNTTDTIRFDVPLEGVIVIKPAIPFQSISGQLFIDGFSQSAPFNKPLIEIDGTAAGANTNGFTIVGDCTIRGLSIHNFTGWGILIRATGGVADNNFVGFNYIGTDAAGIADKGNGKGGVLITASFSAVNNTISNNQITGNGGPGVEISGGGGFPFTYTSNNRIVGNTIGGMFPNDGEGVLIHDGAQQNEVENNTIVINKKDGVRISGSNTDSNIVFDNRIGIQGNAAAPNEKNGVAIDSGAQNNIIGGAPQLNFFYSNTISGNLENGILITGSGTNNNMIKANAIGTNSDGDMAVPNQNNGVLIENGANHTMVGETSVLNLISGNIGNGVMITGNGTNNNQVKFNYIGTDDQGSQSLGNGKNGVDIEAGAMLNVIGENLVGKGFNVISGNGENGVLITGSGTDNNSVGQNFIGSNTLGTAAVPNTKNGILIQDKAKTNKIGVGIGESNFANTVSGNMENGVLIAGDGTNSNEIRYNTIGSAALPNQQNGVFIQDGAMLNQLRALTISGNMGNGIAITGDGSVRNRIFNCFVDNNTLLGIDLGNDGVTPNDEGPSDLLPYDIDTGPNELQNFPDLSEAILGADGNTTIKGILKSTPNTTFALEFLSNTACDPSGYGEGEGNEVHADAVTTNATGDGVITILFAGLAVGDIITATATDPDGNTSEYSKCQAVVAGAVPITLTYFKATLKSKGVLLSWETSQEYNNHFFEILHSVDGLTFSSVGQINGAGTSSIKHEYNFMHDINITGNHFYKLAQVDFDGKQQYSGVERVYITAHAGDIVLFPNPVKNVVTIAVPNGLVNTIATLSNNYGVLQKIKITNNTEAINMQRYASGVYYISFSNGIVQKIMKE
jgi:CSLREA domain-containing protein